MRDANRNQLWSRILIAELVRAGLRHVCVAPGSRSTPLVLACAEEPALELTTHLDERCAAFFALGWGKSRGAPAAVVTTSGTAAANLLPAVVEASQAEVPLLLLTADRPPHLRGADANQAIDQVRIFGGYPRTFFDLEPPRVEPASLRHLRTVAARAMADAVGSPAGPVHLNVPFQKPLEPTPVDGTVPDGFEEDHPRAAFGRAASREAGPDVEPYTRIGRRRSGPTDADRRVVADLVTGASGGGRRGVIVAGPTSEPERVGHAARRFAAATGLPLLADPISGARFTAEPEAPTLHYHDLFLREPAAIRALRPDFIVRIGASPSSAVLRGFLAECGGARQVVVDDGYRYKDHLAAAHEYLRADPSLLLDAVVDRLQAETVGAEAVGPDESAGEWTDRWLHLDAVAERALEAALDGGFFEGVVVRKVVGAVPDGSVIFASNSMPVRDLDTFAAPPGDRSLEVFGNRGASGIDGIVSTALGIARGLDRPVTAILGDLALYHDMNGLLGARESRMPVTFVVINNDGGGIFHMLPIREWDPPFTELFATPHGLHFAHAAELYGLSYLRVEGARELTAALREIYEDGSGTGAGSMTGRSRIIEVISDREENRRRHEEVVAAVRRALRQELGEGA